MKPIVFLLLRAIAIMLGISLVSDSLGYLPVRKTRNR